jgi:hypothetical protein
LPTPETVQQSVLFGLTDDTANSGRLFVVWDIAGKAATINHHGKWLLAEDWRVILFDS